MRLDLLARAPALAALLTVAGCAAEPPPTLAKRADASKALAAGDVDDACRRLMGAERRAVYRQELLAERRPVTLDCELQRQLHALGGYNIRVSPECEARR